MRTSKKIAIAAGTYLVVVASTVAIQHTQLRPGEPPKISEEVLYFPNDKLITYCTAGLKNVVADMVWIYTINFSARTFEEVDLKHRWMDHMIDTVTDLDPYYVDAYGYGGMLMSAFGKSDQGVRLLRKGLLNNPDSFAITFELAQAYLLNKREEPYAKPLVLFYLGMCVERTESKEFFLNWMDGIRRTATLDGQARTSWLVVLETNDDPTIRRLALQKLAVLDARLLKNAYNAALAEYRLNNENARPPISELEPQIRGAVIDLRPDLGSFYYDPNGDVRNTLLDADLVARGHELRKQRLDEYIKVHGANPPNLEAAFGEDYAVLRAHPVPGHAWDYDPATGEISDRIMDPNVPAPFDGDSGR